MVHVVNEGLFGWRKCTTHLAVVVSLDGKAVCHGVMKGPALGTSAPTRQNRDDDNERTQTGRLRQLRGGQTPTACSQRV